MKLNKSLFKSPVVISVANSKGGVGKSMTAVNLAADFSNAGLKVLLVDAEDNGTTLDWQERPESKTLTIINGFDKQFPLMIDVYKKSFDVIVIDTAGVDSDDDTTSQSSPQGYINKKCLSKSDLILVPIDPSPVDIRKSARFFSSVETFVDSSRGQCKALMFLNKAAPREKLTREAQALLVDYMECMPLAETLVRDYVEYKNAESNYKSVIEHAPKSKAADDMRALQAEILTVLGE